jgi:hypothetical protein
MLFVMVFLLGLTFITLFISLFGVIKVEVDEITGQWTFIRIISKLQIDRSQITRYYKTVYNTNRGTTYGLMLEFDKSKIIELNPANLKDVMVLEEYLKQLKIEFSGEKKSNYPFTSGL